MRLGWFPCNTPKSAKFLSTFLFFINYYKRQKGKIPCGNMMWISQNGVVLNNFWALDLCPVAVERDS